MEKKLCSRCKEVKAINEFTKRSKEDSKGRNDNRQSWCYKCVSERRFEIRREKKFKIIGEMGGKCELCGHTSESGFSLSLHHGKPEAKDPTFDNFLSWSWVRIEKEIKNGELHLLCMNCHAEVEYGDANIGV